MVSEPSSLGSMSRGIIIEDILFCDQPSLIHNLLELVDNLLFFTLLNHPEK